MSFDHGILNVPLAKRGNIDSQIDAYKAEVARDEKAKSRARAAELKVLCAEAKALVESLSADRLAAISAKAKLTPTQARKKLRSMAHWSPAFIIRNLSPKAEV